MNESNSESTQSAHWFSGPGSLPTTPKSSTKIKWIFGTLGCLVIVASLAYALFGHAMVRAIYENRSFPSFNHLMSHRQKHPLSYYCQAADRSMFEDLMTVAVLGSTAFLLCFSALCRRISLVLILNLAVFELLLQVLNLCHPFFRPPHLADTYESRFLEGNDWLDGHTRFYVYRPKAGATTYGHPFQVNHWGFRGKEFKEREMEGWGTFRIMVLGDSLTAGQGVAEEDCYPEMLEKKLKLKYPGVKIEVVNLGVAGYETLQEYKALKRMWPVVRANLTIVGFYDNDPNLSYNYYPSYKLPVPQPVRSVFDHLLLFRIPDSLWDPFIRKLRHIPSHQDEIAAAYRPDSRDWSIFEQSVAGIGELVLRETEARPLAIGLMSIPDSKALNEYWPVRNMFEKYGFDWMDPGDQFRIEPVSRFEGHPNARSHQRYAQVLFEKIVDLGLIPQWQQERIL